MMRRLLIALVVLSVAQPMAAQQPPLRLVQTIPMPGVTGRIDHLSVDLQHHRLFVSALGSDSAEIIDLDQRKVAHELSGLHEPQGELYAPDSGKLFVANGDDGTLRMYDAASFRLLNTTPFDSDADDLRYDAKTHNVYLGFGEGGIARIDSSSGKTLGEIKFEGHPEAFEPDGEKTYVNVPTANEIAVLDWRDGRVSARWPLGEFHSNFPMALDASSHRLFVVCRRPAELLVFDTRSGKLVAHLSVVGDSDDLYFDGERKRIYISGGAGAISVVTQQDVDHYRLLTEISTARGARTSLFVPALGRLYLAVPRRGGEGAEIRVYEAQ
jgi:DNA-binding beta-propeller fold protein YncE